MKNLSPKEAITILEGMRIDIPVPKAAVTQRKRNVALDMAINALNCSEIPNSSDSISRQAAIDVLDKRFDSIPMEQTTEILLLRKDLRDLPTAEPQRIKGKWALQSDDYHEYYECDQCGIAVGLDDIRNFCPNCGAKMDGGDEHGRV